MLMLLGQRRTGARWSPSQVSPYAWWDASRADLITLESGSKVSSWKDIIGAYDLTQGTDASRPVYSATGFNGFPCVTGDGVASELTLTGVPVGIPTGATPCEWWWLVDQQTLPADTASKQIGGIGGGAATSTRSLRRNVNTGVNRANMTDSSGTGFENPNVDFSGRHVVRSIATGTDIDLEVNGVAAGLTARVSAVGTGRIRFFANPTTGTAANFWAGAIAASIITPLLSAGQAASMYAYLNQRR